MLEKTSAALWSAGLHQGRRGVLIMRRHTKLASFAARNRRSVPSQYAGDADVASAEDTVAMIQISIAARHASSLL
jgi:hypothetical protein